MIWFTHHRAALLQAVKNLAGAPATTLLNILVIGIALSLPLGLYTLLQNVASLVGQLPQQNRVTIYLRTTNTKADIDTLTKELKQWPTVGKIEVITREQALDEMKQRGLGEVFDALPANPLPDTLHVIPASAEPEAIDKLIKALGANSKIEQVLFDSEWATRLHGLLSFGRWVAWLLAIGLGIALLVIAGNAIRMQVLQRRAEVEISKLIGATNQFIRRPFVYFGVVQGAVGGLVACGIVALALQQLNPAVREIAHSYGSEFALHLPDAVELVIAIAISSALCWLGAVFAVNRSLRQIE